MNVKHNEVRQSFGRTKRFFAMKTILLNTLLIASVLALTVCGARADEEQDLITILESNAPAVQKCDACQQLRLVGTAKAVPALAALLTQERTAHAARYALEGLPYPQAVAALREALGKTSGPIKAGLIDSLGWRRDTASVSLLRKALLDSDPTVASAAASALGRIGGKKAIAALAGGREKVAPAVRPVLLDGLSRCADELLVGGKAKAAAALYRSVFSPSSPERIRIAAWRGLVMADAGGRAELVSKAIAGQEGPLHVAALQVLRELKDASVVEACLRQWPALPADAQLAVLDARLKLGGDVLPCVHTAARSPHLAVRIAAWQALADLDDPAAVPALAKAAACGETAERNVARETLARLHGAGMREALLGQLGRAEAPEKVELLRALGDRGDSAAAAVLLQNAEAQSGAVRLAALEALRKIAVPDTAGPLLKLAAKSEAEADGEPVLEALYAVCQASPDKEQATRTVLAGMKGLRPEKCRLVMPVLAVLGTPAALEAAQAATRQPDDESVKEAVRVLAQWPNAAPAAGLLELGRDATDPVVQILALRGCISVAGQEPDLGKRLGLLRQAMAAAKRPDEKRQALGQLGQVPTVEALQAALSYLADAELANEAGLAAVTIAGKLAASHPEQAREAAAKVLAQCKTPDIIERAWAIGRKHLRKAAFIQDWLVCGPYSKPGVSGAQRVFGVVFPPEEPGAKVSWKPLPRGTVADLADFFPGQVNCAAYLKTEVISPLACDAALLLGSDDGVKAWLNGAVVYSGNVDRGLVADQDMAPVRLKKGANELLLKITQGGGGWGACARIIGMDGQFIKGLKTQVER